MLTLISASPSPFARKVRIAMIENDIPFELKNEIPWAAATETPKYNPLEKLPIMIDDDGTHVYESSFIIEYLREKHMPHAKQPLLPTDVNLRLKARQIEVLATGMMDAMTLIFFEKAREDKASELWLARQQRKIAGGLKALDEIVKGGDGGEFLVGGMLTVADLAVGSVLGVYDLVQIPFKDEYPQLEKYWLKIEERDSFKQTKPFMFDLGEKVV